MKHLKTYEQTKNKNKLLELLYPMFKQVLMNYGFKIVDFDNPLESSIEWYDYPETISLFTDDIEYRGKFNKNGLYPYVYSIDNFSDDGEIFYYCIRVKLNNLNLIEYMIENYEDIFINMYEYIDVDIISKIKEKYPDKEYIFDSNELGIL